MLSILPHVSSIVLLLTTLLFQNITPLKLPQYETNPSTTLHLQVGVNGEYVEDYARTFLERLEVQLRGKGIYLDWSITPPPPDAVITRPDLFIFFQQSQADSQAKVIIFASPVRENLADLSPLLLSGYELLNWNTSPYEQFNKAVTDVNLRFLMALSLYTLKRCDQAEQYFSSVQADLPHLNRDSPNFEAAIEFYRGNCALMNDKLEQAAQLFESSLAAYPQTGIAPNAAAINLAWVYVKLGRSMEAFNLMDVEVERVNSPYTFGALETALKRRSQLHALAFQYDQAIDDLNLLIKKCLSTTSVTPPYCARFYTLRGQTYILLYEWDNVLADYNKALELDPTYADVYFYRGVLQYSILQTGSSLYDDALADFQQYLELAPQGEHAAEATRYASDIQTLLNALNN